ncbi:MAG: terminase large subunit [Clostridiales bacterium]|nr:terminase large subunit [Clostridiales bacterium]MBQ1571424.1 terminase large subunit [Clostridiales bacterium]
MPKKTEKSGDNWIYTYYQGITDGTFLVGRWIQLIYEYLVKGLQEKQFFFDSKKANHAIDWIESHCFHTEGVLAPNPIKLEVWQKAMVSAIFGILDENGNRQFREIVLVIGRKNGKTKLASCISDYVFQVDGGYGTRVFCLAPKLEQADLVYNDIWQMVQLDPEWKMLKEICEEKDEHNKRIHDNSMLVRKRQSDISLAGTNSTIKKIAFSAKKSDGFNPSLVVADEIASWQGDNGLKQYEVMKSAMGARPDGFVLSCTTSGYINDGIYDEIVKRSTRFLLGDSKEKRLLPLLYMIDDIEKWNDINELRKANPNLAVSVSVDYLLEEIAIAEGSLSKRSEFICKYACLKQNASTAWLPANIVEDACGEPLNLEDFRDHYCVGGIDLSQSRDLTSACVVIEKGGELYVFSHFWLPTEKIDEASQRDGMPYNIYIQRGLLSASGDNFVDYHDVYDWFRDLVEDYQILPLQVGYDRYSASYLIQAMQAAGFHCDDVFQGEQLYPILQEMQSMLESKKIHIGDNDLLKSHLLNSAIKMSTERGRGKLVKLSPSLHIDGTAALVDALTVRSKYYGEISYQLKNEE